METFSCYGPVLCLALCVLLCGNPAVADDICVPVADPDGDTMCWLGPLVFMVLLALGIIIHFWFTYKLCCDDRGEKYLRSDEKSLLMNVSMSTFLAVVFAIPTVTGEISGWSWPDDIDCGAVQYFTYVSIFAAAFSLVLVVLQPWIGKAAPRYITLVWIVLFVVNIDKIYTYDVFADLNPHCQPMDSCVFLVDAYTEEVFKWLFVLGFIVFPLLTVLVYRSASTVEEKGSAIEIEMETQKRACSNLAVCVFFVMWIPLGVVMLLKVHGAYPQSSATLYVQIFVLALAHGSFCFVPLVFIFRHPVWAFSESVLARIPIPESEIPAAQAPTTIRTAAAAGPNTSFAIGTPLTAAQPQALSDVVYDDGFGRPYPPPLQTSPRTSAPPSPRVEMRNAAFENTGLLPRVEVRRASGASESTGLLERPFPAGGLPPSYHEVVGNESSSMPFRDRSY